MLEISQKFSQKHVFLTTRLNGRNTSDLKVLIKGNQLNAMLSKPIHLSPMATNIKVIMVD